MTDQLVRLAKARTFRGITALLLIAVPLLLAASWPRQEPGLDAGVMWHEVQPLDLGISVVERGNLESQTDLDVYCEVEDVRRDGINGTPIQWLIPNGSKVEAGELIVELESAPLQEALDEQVLETEDARAEKIQAEANYENQLTQNETSQAEAELDVKLAKLELEMFVDEESGTHKLAVEEIRRSIEDVNNEILSAQANLELKRDDQAGTKELFKLGYAGRSELRRTQLDFLQAESQYASKLNKLQTQLATLKKTQSYERRMELMRLEGKVQTAERQLQQVIRNNQAKVAQMEAVMRARTESLKKEEERLERYQTQLAACKIYAPQDGMVAYASDRRDEIREGVPVRYRQRLLSIPDLKRMQVQTAVHESVLDQIDQGLSAKITVDAFPDRSYPGTVQSVAVLPDQDGWRSSDTKVYETVVTIDEEVQQLKPGMTAVVQIFIDRLEGVLAVPLQAVVQRGETNWVFVRSNGRAESREVDLGRSNDSQVEVVAGLEAGEHVALNPGELAKRLLPDDQ